MISGIQKTSLIEYPGKICTVLFTGGCNLRCPFCHNPGLVNKPAEKLDEGEILEFLEERKKWVDGVVITGGEPLIHPGIIDFIKKVKSKGFFVKLDTNGLNPSMLKKVIELGHVDFFAMDIKSDKDHYSKAVGIPINITLIEQSVLLIQHQDKPYEFRSTIVPDFFDFHIIENIGMWLKGSKRYVIQQFRSNVPLVDKSYEGKASLDLAHLNRFKDIMQNYVDVVELRV